ncbi:putative phosphodiesterase [Natranaerovirga hydrolytica]|uniref:Putative phosphodiesterase n=1 Tax=Natranaerovirga hydrolytica TaxID=680378 RepID=A0A4R1N286_9FIRM|nr:metallophosphoesterase family protein [Natranaerovirga hydrolytica]TCK98114.1 putative phosphodiesterase [Natranaerovirga hydrolytica]
MERIALISDIHGNLPAIQSVAQELKVQNIDKVICLGDMIGKGPNSAETLDVCREISDMVIMGNWEKFIGNNPTPGDVNWVEVLGKERLEYIKTLPETIGFYLSGKYVRLFHAHPHDLFKRVFSTSPLEERLEMFEIPKLGREECETCESDIVGYGDIHGAFIETINGGKTLFNTGSIGNACDYLPMASYVILEGNYGSKEPGNFGIQFCRVEYDTIKAANQAFHSNIPQKEAYIQEVKTGVYCIDRNKQ